MVVIVLTNIDNEHTSSNTSVEAVSSLFRLFDTDRYCFEVFNICLFNLTSLSDSTSVASRIVVNDKPLSG